MNVYLTNEGKSLCVVVVVVVVVMVGRTESGKWPKQCKAGVCVCSVFISGTETRTQG